MKRVWIGLSLLLLIGIGAGVDAGGMAETARIVTIAGGAIPSTGLRSLERAIGEPTSIAPDNAGGAYFVSKTHGLVYHAAQNGALRVIAGQGGQTFSGDGGPATSAQLKGPSGIAVDRTGNLTGSALSGAFPPVLPTRLATRALSRLAAL